MVIEEELKRQQDKIFFFNSYLQMLNVKLYYEKNRRCENEYKQNENRISILNTENKLNKVKQTLEYLLSEYQQSFDYYVELCKKEEDEK